MNLIAVLGPTAGGKTSFAAHLAAQLNTEVISADSRQIYRGMDLGTGKDLKDYVVDGKQVKCHLTDIVDAGVKYNLFEYQKEFFKVFVDMQNRNLIPVLCGGTGLYLESAVRNYKLIDVPQNPQLRQDLEKYSLQELKNKLAEMKTLHNNTDTDTKKRAIRAIEIETFIKQNPKIIPQYPEIKPLIFGIKNPRDVERKKIAFRLEERLNEGMVEEIETLLKNGVPEETLIYYGLEYKFVTLYVTGKLKFDEMKQLLEIAICQFAKRQMTWFRRMERLGMQINWIDGQLPMDKKISFALDIFNSEK